MKKWKLMGLALAVAASISACVPVATGSSAYSPLIYDSLVDPVKISRGATWHISTIYSPSRFDINPTDLNRLFPPPTSVFKGDRIRQSLAGFSFVNANAPEGWRVNLAAVYAHREVTDLVSNSYYYRQGVELVFSVEVPRNTETGTKAISAIVRHNGKSESASFRVVVE